MEEPTQNYLIFSKGLTDRQTDIWQIGSVLQKLHIYRHKSKNVKYLLFNFFWSLSFAITLNLLDFQYFVKYWFLKTLLKGHVERKSKIIFHCNWVSLVSIKNVSNHFRKFVVYLIQYMSQLLLTEVCIYRVDFLIKQEQTQTSGEAFSKMLRSGLSLCLATLLSRSKSNLVNVN